MDLTVILFLIFCYLFQVILYQRYFRGILHAGGSGLDDKPSVSLIICGKNEAENCKINLPLLCEQDYIDYEVLYMDDHSTDNTEQVIMELCAEYPHLRYVKASDAIKGKHGKKWALEEAKTKAANEILLLTDADCQPGSSSWIRLMVSKFDKGVDVVLGVGQYEYKHGLVNALIQYETLFTAMSYLGFATGGVAYMGVGRNLAYKKSISKLTQEKGTHLLSGDDDLFLQTRLDGKNAAICIEHGARTISPAPEDFGSWLRQKTRHYSTAFYYNTNVKALLLLLKSSFYLPNLLVLYLLFSDYMAFAIGLFVVRSLIWVRYLNKIRKELEFPRQIYLVPCYEIFFSLFDSWITIKNLMTRPRHWK